jgi:hypothetical protein
MVQFSPGTIFSFAVVVDGPYFAIANPVFFDLLQVYNVHESLLNFQITVGVNISTAASTAGQMFANYSQVNLSPSLPKGRTSDKKVSAQLVGDLMPYNAFPVLTSQRLLLPALMDMSQLRPAEWMLVDPTLITMDGSECNKIGVGFSAFRLDPSWAQCFPPVRKTNICWVGHHHCVHVKESSAIDWLNIVPSQENNDGLSGKATRK